MAASSLFKSCGERPRAVHQPRGAVETWVRQVVLVVAVIPRIACLPMTFVDYFVTDNSKVWGGVEPFVRVAFATIFCLFVCVA